MMFGMDNIVVIDAELVHCYGIMVTGNGDRDLECRGVQGSNTRGGPTSPCGMLVHNLLN